MAWTQQTNRVPSNGRGGGYTTQVVWVNSDTGERMADKDYQNYIRSQRQAEEMRARGLNPDGSPLRPEWNSLLNADGTLKDQYQLQTEADVTYDPSGYNEVKNLALRTGPSAWAQLQLDQQKAQQAAQVDQAAKQSAGAQSNMFAQMAMRGGLGGGARNRMASQALRNQLMSQQDIARQGNLNRLNIGSQDETNRLNMLNNLTNLDVKKGELDVTNRAYRTNVAQTNLQNSLKEVDARRAYDQNMYQELMKKWAAEKDAEAQRNSGGGGK